MDALIVNMASIPLDLRYQKCVAWAIERGVQINGVMPAQAPGRGLGVFAQRNIKVPSLRSIAKEMSS